MRNHSGAAAMVLAAALITATGASAQQPAVVSLSPENPARWDVSVHAGWFGGNKTEIGTAWNRWYDSAAFGVAAGYYWTPRLKVEADVATTTEGDFFSQEQLIVPGQPSPVFRAREYFFRSTTVAGGLTYQFLENTWFHPFAGVGIEAGRETARIEIPPQFIFTRDGMVLTRLTGTEVERETSSWMRPLVSAGFKWYLSERAFIRSEVRASFSTEHAESVVWRGGVGVDF